MTYSYNNMNIFWIVLFLIGFSIFFPNIHAETITQNMEGGIDIDITYPNEIIVWKRRNYLNFDKK